MDVIVLDTKINSVILQKMQTATLLKHNTSSNRFTSSESFFGF